MKWRDLPQGIITSPYLRLKKQESVVSQLSNPQHVHIRHRGDYLRHSVTDDSTNPPNWYKGERIRFTRAAAEAIMKKEMYFKNAVLEPVEIDGVVPAR